MTGVRHEKFCVQHGHLDRELAMLKFSKLLKDAEMQKRRCARL
jgi:hypothetical protein